MMRFLVCSGMERAAAELFSAAETVPAPENLREPLHAVVLVHGMARGLPDRIRLLRCDRSHRVDDSAEPIEEFGACHLVWKVRREITLKLLWCDVRVRLNPQIRDRHQAAAPGAAWTN